MATIFISGSREIRFVPDEARARIDRIIDSGFDIVVGDSERGVDSVILRYLESRSYAKVTVFTVHDKPRIKSFCDSWHVCIVEPTVAVKTDRAGNIRNRRELETEKDQTMGAIADFGLVIWQSTYTNRFGSISVSKGSLRNMHQLLIAGKPVVLYKTGLAAFDETGFDCFELKSLSDLEELVASEPSIVGKAYLEIKKEAPRVIPSLFDAMG